MQDITSSWHQISVQPPRPSFMYVYPPPASSPAYAYDQAELSRLFPCQADSAVASSSISLDFA